jgi:hypothetical protein
MPSGPSSIPIEHRILSVSGIGQRTSRSMPGEAVRSVLHPSTSPLHHGAFLPLQAECSR